MKKTIAIALTALIGVFVLTSCGGGGYTEENKASMKETCSSLMKISYDDADAVGICDCYITKLVEKYPNADFTPEQNQGCMDECSTGFKSKFDKEQEAAAAAAAAAAATMADTTAAQ